MDLYKLKVKEKLFDLVVCEINRDSEEYKMESMRERIKLAKIS